MSGGNLNDLTLHYFVDDLPGAYLPATRMASILERIHKSRSLNSPTSAYLKKQGLQALYRHAHGDSTFDEFRKDAKEEQSQRRHVVGIVEAKKNEQAVAMQARMKQKHE